MYKGENDVVIYHANCHDGFCAAWVAWLAGLPKAEYVPASYGDAPPNVLGKQVYVLDFGYPPDVMDKICTDAVKVILIDHHKTNAEAMQSFERPNLHKHISMKRSGAGLALEYFFMPGTEKWLVDYIEDRDLWKHALPHSKAVNAFIKTLPFDFEVWKEQDESVGNLTGAIASGYVVQRATDQYVEMMAKNAREMHVRVKFDSASNLTFEVPIVNAPTYAISELLHKLAQNRYFAVGWFQRSDGKYQYSLRSDSKGHDFDVAAVAKMYGGGGHKNAAGFESHFTPEALFAHPVSLEPRV